MADQDFQIRVVTTADTSGIRQVSGELDNLERKAAQPADAAKLAARRESLRSALTPVPIELAAPELPIKEAAEATKELGENALFAGLNLSRARQEATFLARELATGVPTTRTLSSLLGALGIPIAAGTLAGFALNKAITANAERQREVNEEIDKQGTKLVELAKRWTELAKVATSPADVGRIAGAAATAMEDVTARLQKAQKETLTWYQELIDALVKAPSLGGTIFQSRMDQRLNLLLREREELAKQAAAAIKQGQEYEKAFESRKLEPTTKAISEITAKIESLKDKQAGLNPLAADYAEQWRTTQNEISENEKQLSEFVELGKQQSEIGKDNLSVEKQINDAIARVTSDLRAMGVAAQTPGAAFEAGLRAVEPMGAKIRSLASEWDKLQAKQRETLAGDLTKGVVDAAKAAAERQATHAREVAAARELAAEGIGREVSAADERRSQLDEELRALQRVQALQRTLIPPEAGPAEMLKALGVEGLKEFEARAVRIQEIIKAIGLAPGATVNVEATKLDTAATHLDESATKLSGAADKLAGGKAAAPAEGAGTPSPTEPGVSEVTTAAAAFLAGQKAAAAPAVPSGPSLTGAEAEAARREEIERTAEASRAAELERQFQIDRTAQESQAAEEQRRAEINQATIPATPAQQTQPFQPALSTEQVAQLLRENTNLLQKLYQLWQ